ncbi:relaxin receptor 2 [Anoplophora glabripennis]|uniref:relaxin receptor 2 n=1 Tax=Anoplophora glabripennis TaxID=217634 RepID=UPI000874D462|nr:relaxin receptor 2 [Anoplophora glabripennis]
MPELNTCVVDRSFTDVPRGICIEGYFQCENETVCVPQDSNCDGKVDCQTGSDEMNCDDKHDDDYWDHLYRKNIAAEHDDFGNICFLWYNGSCACRARDLLCQHKNYDAAPRDIPQVYIDILDFTGNNFKHLGPETVEHIPDLVDTLTMVHCNVTEVAPKTFYKLKNVKNLHLDNNHLKLIPPDVFPEDNRLQTLTLMYNDISKVHHRAFENLQQLVELDLRGNKLTEIQGRTLEPLRNLTILFLQNNQIKYVEASSFPPIPLHQLSLMDNKIMEMDRASFANLHNLRSLFLSNNRLTMLKNGTFLNLTALESLTLNDNFIRIIELGVFGDVPNLNSLKLQRNQFRSLEKNMLLPLTKLATIYFDRFEMCASATHVRVCLPKGDGISSQEHMLDNPLLRTCVWVMGAIGCTGNIIVLLGRLFAPTNNVVHSLYLRNLALSDLLMGVYLFIIAAVDQHYRGVYLRHEYNWRHSYMCSLCGFLSTLSCESSVLILSLVTWDRFISVTQPLARNQPSPKTAALTLLVLWCIAAIVSLAPLSHLARSYFGDEFYGSNGVCLSLHIHDPYAKGWEYSAAMFIMINALALVFISYAYMRMINEIRASGVACRSTRQSQDRDKVAQRFGIIVFTDSLCWVPVIVVKILALSGVVIPADLYAWLAIFVLPINSALNPVLYTLTTTIFKKQVRKIFHSCRQRKRNEHHHSASDSGFSLSFGVFPIAGSTRRILSYRGTQSSSLTASKNSWKRSTAV